MRCVLPLLIAAASVGAAQDLETAAGGTFSLEKTLAHGPAVLVFWNAWLPASAPFVAVVREVDRAAAENGWPGAVVIFQDETETAVRSLAHEGAALPRVLDRRGVLLRRFQVTKAPTVLVVDRSGKVIDRSGPDPDQVSAMLAQLASRGAGSR